MHKGSKACHKNVHPVTKNNNNKLQKTKNPTTGNIGAHFIAKIVKYQPQNLHQRFPMQKDVRMIKTSPNSPVSIL